MTTSDGSATVDVVICGGGVAGLVAALVLGQAGWRVRLLERSPKVPAIHKGEVIQPRSIEILDRLGALPAVSADAVPAQRLVCLDGKGNTSVALDYAPLPGPYPQVLLNYYPSILTALELSLPTTVQIDRGVRVTGLVEDDGGRVVGVRTGGAGGETVTRARLVLACDGLASGLRAAAGLPVEQEQYGHRLLAFDLAGDPTANGVGGGVDGGADLNAYLTARGLRLVYPMPGGRTRLYVQTRPDEYRRVGRAGLAPWAAQVLRDAPGLAGLREAFLGGLDTVQPLPAWRYLAPRWWRPGFALLGDAAHGVHPMAAQGMNAAIADAWELGRALEKTDLDAPEALDGALASYERAGIERMLYTGRLSNSLARLFTDVSWRTGLPSRLMVRRGLNNARLQHILAYNIAGLGVRRFTRRDRLYLAGLLRDPAANQLPDLPPVVL